MPGSADDAERLSGNAAGDSSAAHVSTARGLVVPADSLSWRFTRSSAPGGQHVNKTSTSAELRCDLTALRGPPATVALVRARLGDEVRLVSSAGRSQWRNRQLAIERLVDRLDQAAVADAVRHPTRPSRAAVRERLADKRARSERKRARNWRPDD